MSLSVGISLVRSPSFHASYLLGREVAAPELAIDAEPPEARSIAKLGDDSDNPTYIFTEPRVGYRMPKGETWEGEYPVSALQLEPANRGITFVAKVSRFVSDLLNGIPICENSTRR